MARNFTPVGSTTERYPGILSLGKPCNETVPAPPWHYSLTNSLPPSTRIQVHDMGHSCASVPIRPLLYHVGRPLAKDKPSKAGVSNDSIIKKSLSSITQALHPFQNQSPFSTNFSRGVHKMNTRQNIARLQRKRLKRTSYCAYKNSNFLFFK